MGSVRRWVRRSNVVIKPIVAVSKELDSINERLVEIDSTVNDIDFVGEIARVCSRAAILVWLLGAMFVVRYFCVDLANFISAGETLPMAFFYTTFNQVGQILAFIVFHSTVSMVSSAFDKFANRKTTILESKRASVRRDVYRLLARTWLAATDYALPDKVSIEEYADVVVRSAAAVVTVAGPVFAICCPNFSTFFRVHSTVRAFYTFRDLVFGFISDTYHSFIGLSRQCKFFTVSGALAALSGSYWLYSRRRAHRRPRSTRVVPKKNQRVYPGHAPVDPVDPSELNFVPDFVKSKGCVSLKTFPEAPSFDGFAAVHSSIVRINGNYGATAFRVGQNLITAAHCVGRDPAFPGYGIPCYNPDDQKVYWAPIEKYFPSRIPTIPNDGIVVCSLPNADFFLTRNSAQLSVPKTNIKYAGAYRTQGFKGKPKYTFSIGQCEIVNGYLAFKASVERGSSGGPIINQDGSVIAVTVAESYEHNAGFLITQEIVDFLTKGGAAEHEKSDHTHPEESGTEYTSTSESEESCSECEETPQCGGNGQTHAKRKRSTKSRSSNGPTPNDVEKPKKKKKQAPEEARRKKKPSGPQTPPPDAHPEYNGPVVAGGAAQ